MDFSINFIIYSQTVTSQGSGFRVGDPSSRGGRADRGGRFGVSFSIANLPVPSFFANPESQIPKSVARAVVSNAIRTGSEADSNSVVYPKVDVKNIIKLKGSFF